MNIDQELFQDHLNEAPFQFGVSEAKWRIIENGIGQFDWPIAIIEIFARQVSGCPESYYLKLELSKYNHQAPLGTFWDMEHGRVLPVMQRPKVSGIHQQAFRNDWKGGVGMYAPWDRSGLAAHPEWARRHAAIAWKPGCSRIEDYLNRLWSCLNSEQYFGTYGG